MSDEESEAAVGLAVKVVSSDPSAVSVMGVSDSGWAAVWDLVRDLDLDLERERERDGEREGERLRGWSEWRRRSGERERDCR